MTWISKFDTTFIIYVDRKFSKRFVNYDNFTMWLYYEKNNGDDKEYYRELDNLIREYSNWQQTKVKEFKELE